jgi:hypothetical protein
VAKQPTGAPAKQAPKIPDNWRDMNAAEKLEWRRQNQGHKPPAKPGTSSGAPQAPQAPQQQPQQQPENPYPEQSQEQGQEQPNAEQIGSDVAHMMSNEDARGLVAKILRAVADALDYGTGVE